MSEHGRPQGETAGPSSGLTKVADSIEAFLKPIYTWFGYLGALTLGLLIVAMLYSIVARRFFDAPLVGSTEITQLALVTFIALCFGIEHLGHEKMAVDVLTKHLPKKMQVIIAPIIYLLAVGVFCVVVWQMITLAETYREAGLTMRNLTWVVVWPFTYLLAFGFLTLLPIWVARFLRSIDRLVKK